MKCDSYEQSLWEKLYILFCADYELKTEVMKKKLNKVDQNFP